CPYCARVRIVLAEKGLEYETVAIDLADRPDWLYEKNPIGKVPVLEEDALCLPESAVIMEYLDERYPEPALMPTDPADRARVRLLHAFPFDPAMWKVQRPVLEDHDVIAPTIYGRGNSMDAWAASILDEVEGSFVAVGASMGGGCALAMARQQPQRMEAIVLAG